MDHNLFFILEKECKIVFAIKLKKKNMSNVSFILINRINILDIIFTLIFVVIRNKKNTIKKETFFSKCPKINCYLHEMPLAYKK